MLRHPKTTQERRANGKRNKMIVEDYEIKLRSKRNMRALPNSHDDLWEYPEKCWKSYREKQYRIK